MDSFCLRELKTNEWDSTCQHRIVFLGQERQKTHRRKVKDRRKESSSHFVAPLLLRFPGEVFLLLSTQKGVEAIPDLLHKKQQ